jgi:hypothetical protein
MSHESSLLQGHRSHENERKKEEKMGSVPADRNTIVQYILNTRVSATTKRAPFELWMGHIPRAHQPDRLSNIPRIEWHKDKIQEVWWQAQESIKRVQELWAKERLRVFSPYQKNDKVWLEAKNLKTMHPTTKLCPLQYRPFTIIKVLSPVTYHLKLPPQWKIHDVFHASLLMPYKETDCQESLTLNSW